MKRLTSYKNEYKRELICRYDECSTEEEHCPYLNEDNCHCLQDVLRRLAEYEDIGLLPEQIKEVDRLYAEKCKELAEQKKSYLSGWELANIWVALEKLKEYRNLDEQGKLLKMPCAVGNTVYEIN